MKYEGIKFKTRRISDNPPQDKRIDHLIKWCGIFHQHDLAPPYPGGSYGNLSFRTGSEINSFIITGSCIGLKNQLDFGSFVEILSCDPLRKLVKCRGSQDPSSETLLHYAIYKARSDVNAIFHGHSRFILEHAEQLGLPVTAEEKPYGTIELVSSVLSILDDHDVIVMKNHGFISVAGSLNTAGEQVLKLIKKYKEI